jgi:hypothetical protein
MFATIINDCRDDNARGRQNSRVAALLGITPSFVGVESDLEAGVQLIDILDATDGATGLILVNVAPRGGHTTKWPNGTPFAYFYYGETLIITTVDGYILSAVKKFGLVDEVQLLDTTSASEAMIKADFVSEPAGARIPKSQFRSFDFIPRVGAFILKGNTVPSEAYSLNEIPNLPPAVWHIDNFGNCKTTLTAADLHGASELNTRYGTLPHITQLRDVPDLQDALTVGSSGIGEHRFLELVRQRTPFAKVHDVNIDDDIFEDRSYYVSATKPEGNIE